MSVLATDDFNRANSGTLGANWGVMSGLSSSGIVSNACSNASPSGDGNYYSATAAPNDGYAQVTIVTPHTVSDEGAGPSYRAATGANTMYFTQANTVETRLYKVVAGSYTQLGSDGPAVTGGDVLKIVCNGTSISVTKNGSTIIGPVTDSAISSGRAGIWMAGSPTDSFSVDNFEMGDFGGSDGLLGQACL